ncbi:MAG: hypothetical protein O2877_00465 [bacterium]|nr:hypothetical protein [bacterium]
MPRVNRKHTEKFSTFTLEAKVAVVLFMIVATGGVVYGFRGVAFRLKQPFLAQLNYSGPAYLSVEEREIQAIEEQKKRDTDQDGINDYDEINIFNSSPYLVDTDSDGVADAIEISEGRDPACPEGQDCRKSFSASDAQGQQPGIAGLPSAPPQLDIDFSTFGSTVDLESEIKQKSVTELREILLKTGLSPSIVSTLSDQAVQEIFEKTLQNTEDIGEVEKLLQQQQERALVEPVVENANNPE